MQTDIQPVQRTIETRNKDARRNKWLAGLAILVGIILIALFIHHSGHKPPAAEATAGAGAQGSGAGAQGSGAPASSPPLPVSVLTAQVGAMSKTVAVVGQLQSDNRVSLTSKVPGKITRLLVSTGDRVEAGQLVAELDNTDVITQLQQSRANEAGAEVRLHQAEAQVAATGTQASSAVTTARANLASAQSRLQQAQAGLNLKDVQTQANITAAREALAGAKSKLQQMITTAQIEDTQADTGVQQAKANLESAQQNLALVQQGAREQERAQANLAVERAQSEYNQAQDNFNRMDNLYKAGAIAQQTRENANFSLQVAKTALDTARQQTSLIHEGPTAQQAAIAQQQVNQAKAALQLAQAQVARRALSRQDVVQAENQVRQLTAQLQVAQAGTSQYVVTRQDIRQAEDQVRQMTAALQVAQANLTQIRQTSQDDVRAARAQIRQAQAQVTLAQQQLADTRIYSPVSGIVDTRPASIGSSILPTTVLMTISPIHGLYFEAQVPESSISSVRVGQTVSTTVDALPGRTFNGRISEIIPVAEASTKLYRVHVSLPNTSGALPQNGYARGQIVISQVKGIIIAKDALLSTLGDYYLFVVENKHAVRHDVRLGLSDDVRAQVLSGLKAGDRYITSGKESVTNGAAVEVRPDPRMAAMS